MYEHFSFLFFLIINLMFIMLLIMMTYSQYTFVCITNYLLLTLNSRKILYTLSKEMVIIHFITLLRITQSPVFEQVFNIMRVRKLLPLLYLKVLYPWTTTKNIQLFERTGSNKVDHSNSNSVDKTLQWKIYLYHNSTHKQL